MPKLDGLSLVKRINEIDSTPIICITGHSGFEADVRVSGLDFVTVLTKPFELEELDFIISNIMSRK